MNVQSNARTKSLASRFCLANPTSAPPPPVLFFSARVYARIDQRAARVFGGGKHVPTSSLFLFRRDTFVRERERENEAMFSFLYSMTLYTLGGERRCQRRGSPLLVSMISL